MALKNAHLSTICKKIAGYYISRLLIVRTIYQQSKPLFIIAVAVVPRGGGYILEFSRININ